MLRVLPVFSTQNYRARETRVPKLAMRSLPARRNRESGGLKIGDELADFAGHVCCCVSTTIRITA
jgi:hypothetical protein